MADGISFSVGIRNAAFHQGLDSMRAGVQKFRGDLSNMFAGAVGFGAFTAAITKALTYADKVADLSEIYGVGTTDLQKLGQAAEQNASSMEAMAGALQKLEVNRSKALQGNDELQKKFLALGITMEDLQAASPADLMAKIGAGAMNSADMVAILGKSSLELVPALRAVANGSAELWDTMSDSEIKALASLNDRLKEIENTITVGAGKAIVWFSNQWQKETVAIVTLWKMVVDSVVAGAKIIGNALVGDFSGVKSNFSEWKENIRQLDETRQRTQAEIASPSDDDDEDEKAAEKRRLEEEAAANRQEQLAQRVQRLRDAEAEAALNALETEEKINALIAERARLMEITAANGETNEEGVEAAEKLLKVNQQLEAEEKKAAEEAMRQEKAIADARADEAQAQLEYDRSLMDPADRMKSLQEEKQALLDQAAELEETDAAAAAKKRTQAIAVQRDIDAEGQKMADEAAAKQKELADKLLKEQEAKAQRERNAAANITVSSLQAVGGGGNIGAVSSADPGLRESQEQTRLQRELVALFRSFGANAPANIPNPWSR